MARVKIGNAFPPLAWLLQRCAPAGFGLGGKSALLTAKDDLNNIKANGWYYWHSDSVPAHAPTMNYTSYMICMRVWTTDGGVCCQELMDMTDSVARGTKIQRTAYVDTFYDWEWVNPPMFSGIEYRTTERWNGKPVYAALVNVGAFPEEGTRIASTGITATGVIRFSAAFDYASLPIPGFMEIYTHHDGEEITVKLQTVSERVYSGDTYVSLYYIKD